MTAAPAGSQRYDVAVVGAGFAGLYALYRCRELGFRTVGIEAGSDVGGTWYWNRYPGARCDVESIDYSYSFDHELQQTWAWSERYATQPEILAYAQHVADRFDLRTLIRFDTCVEAARYDQDQARWALSLDAGEPIVARHLLLATGSLSAVNHPEIPGIDTFAGAVLYTARWPAHAVSFAHQRVGIVGTGSSGIQCAPLMAQEADALVVFQRSPNYTIPAPNRPLGEDDWEQIRPQYQERRRRSRVSSSGMVFAPYAASGLEVDDEERQRIFEESWRQGGVHFAKTFGDQMLDEQVNALAREFAAAKVRAVVADPATAERLIPKDHPIGTKRICTDTGYYETFNLPHVRLVDLRTEPIDAITATGVRTAAETYDLDTVILATGFDAMTGSVTRIDIRGAGGTHIRDAWADGPRTYLGLAVPGFPNMFILNGPGSPSVLCNMIMHAEAQVEWVAAVLSDCRTAGVDEIEARADAAERWTRHVHDAAAATLMVQANSWYMGANIEGKPRGFMPYVGGLGPYCATCERERAEGYPGFMRRG